MSALQDSIAMYPLRFAPIFPVMPFVEETIPWRERHVYYGMADTCVGTRVRA